MSTVFLVLCLCGLALWGVSLLVRDASIVDIFWGLGFLVVIWTCAEGAMGSLPPRALLVSGLVHLWGLRLAIYLARRNLGNGEDARYQRMRASIGPHFWWVSLFSVFLLQMSIMWVISLPIQTLLLGAQEKAWHGLDGLGAGLWLVGFLFESIGDAQLKRFKADPNNKGKVMDRGLWRYTRHPNYFGESLIWWGIFLLGMAGGNPWWTVISPVLMTFLLLRVSGVSLLERHISETRPAYADYVKRTNAFLPWLPRKRC